MLVELLKKKKKKWKDWRNMVQDTTFKTYGVRLPEDWQPITVDFMLISCSMFFIFFSPLNSLANISDDVYRN